MPKLRRGTRISIGQRGKAIGSRVAGENAPRREALDDGGGGNLSGLFPRAGAANPHLRSARFAGRSLSFAGSCPTSTPARRSVAGVGPRGAKGRCFKMESQVDRAVKKAFGTLAFI
eukprot:g18737.t1